MKTIYMNDLFRKIKCETNTSEASYNVWLKTLQIEDIDFIESKVTLPSPFAASAIYVKKRYESKIVQAIKKAFGQKYEVEIISRDNCGEAREKIVLPESVESKFEHPTMYKSADFLFLCEDSDCESEEKQDIEFRSSRVFCVPKDLHFFVNTEYEFVLVEIWDKENYYVISPKTTEAERNWLYCFVGGLEYKVHGELVRVVEE